MLTKLTDGCFSYKTFGREVARIPEIRDLICEFCELFGLYEECPTSALACLLRVNRDFFFSTIRLLWATTNGSDLLVLLPGVSMEYPYEYLSRITESDTPDLIPENYFDRFNTYAPYVRDLELAHTISFCDKSLRSLSIVRSYAQTHVLLPNLISLSTRDLRSYWGYTIDTMLDWLEVLVSPSLQRLDLSPFKKPDSYPAPNPRLCAPIIAGFNFCSNLSELSFCYDHSSTPTGLYAVTPTSLTTIRCHHAPFRLEFFTWLAGIPNLQSLEFDSSNSPSFSYAASLIDKLPTLAKLRSLTLENCPAVFATSLCGSPLVKNIVRLCMNFHSIDEWHSAIIISTFFEQLPKFCPKITELVLYCSGLRHSPTLFSPIHNIRLLRTLPLQELTLGTCDRDMLGEPDVIRQVLDALPTLRELDIRLYEVGLEDLRMILPFCSRLSVLRLYIRVMLPVEALDEELTHASSLRSGTAYPALKLLSLGQDDPEWDHSHSALDRISRYILSLRPNISFWVRNDDVKPWTTEPYEWADYLNAQLSTPINT